MEEPAYRKLQEDIRYCKSLSELETKVQRILAPTGFGSNSLADTEEPVGLNYQEMADCLLETDIGFSCKGKIKTDFCCFVNRGYCVVCYFIFGKVKSFYFSKFLNLCRPET